MSRQLPTKGIEQRQQSLLNELLLSASVAYNYNELQVSAYRDYLTTHIKTTRNDKERSATARYNLVKKCELNALACFPQLIVDNDVFESLTTPVLVLLGERDIFSTSVTNKLDFINSNFEGEWHHLLTKSIHKHECLFEKMIKKIVEISNATALTDAQKHCAIDTLLYGILFIIRFHGSAFREVYREGFNYITRQSSQLSSYQLYNLSSFGAFAHYDDDIIRLFNSDHYQKYRNHQYLVYAHKKTKRLFRESQGSNANGTLVSIVNQHIKEDDILSLGEYGLKCLRFPVYFTFPLTKIALDWVRFTLIHSKPPLSKKYASFSKKAAHVLKLEKNRLSQEPEIKLDLQRIMGMLDILRNFSQ